MKLSHLLYSCGCKVLINVVEILIYQPSSTAVITSASWVVIRGLIIGWVKS